MKPPQHLRSNWILGGLALALALATAAPSAHANVYATNIKLNGGMSNISVAQGASVSISYILNEAASTDLTIKILSGSTPVRTITIAGGSAGTTRGLNTVSWNGKDDGGNNVATGNYSVSIKAAATGYSGWTLTTDDNNEGNQVWEPRGIAVDRNANSPYYGRVFAANANPNGTTPLGYQQGILKCNADGSYADEGGFSTGGYSWTETTAGEAPWKIRVSDDDYVYVEDWSGNGDVLRWDPTLSTPSGGLHVLRSDNWSGTMNLSGMAIFGTGINTEIWMADSSYSTDQGIFRWNVTGDGTCALNDLGTQIVRTHFGSDLNLYAWSVALDPSHNIYTIQNRSNVGDVANRVFRFPAYSGTVETAATWKVGSAAGEDWCGAYGLAVDPTGTYLAVGFRGKGSGVGGNTKIFSTTDGSVVTSLDYNVDLSGYTQKLDRDVDWDAVGNVYLVDSYFGGWRAYSPPGANEATTVAVPTVQVTTGSSLVAATITSITPDGSGNLLISYSGGSGSQFVLMSSSSVTASRDSWTRGETKTTGSGTFTVSIGSGLFYCVKSE